MGAPRRTTASIFIGLTTAVVFLVIAASGVRANAEAQGSARDFTIVGSKYAFQPGSITVDRNDLVKITFNAEDIPHSFTIDGYRISKRAGAGQSVTFEFRADQPGTFDYYCNLTQDDKCKSMRGRLVVR
jgi:heme/copper-type cytochrome/quinol oxidase subunit 2